MAIRPYQSDSTCDDGCSNNQTSCPNHTRKLGRSSRKMCAMRQGLTRRSFALIYALLFALPSLPSASAGVGRCHCHRCCAQLDHAAMGRQAVVAGTRLVNCPRCLSGQCPAYCSGPASGCEGSGPGLIGVGCYGVAEVNGAAIGGNCVCETGEFSQPERLP